MLRRPRRIEPHERPFPPTYRRSECFALDALPDRSRCRGPGHACAALDRSEPDAQLKLHTMLRAAACVLSSAARAPLGPGAAAHRPLPQHRALHTLLDRHHVEPGGLLKLECAGDADISVSPGEHESVTVQVGPWPAALATALQGTPASPGVLNSSASRAPAGRWRRLWHHGVGAAADDQ